MTAALLRKHGWSLETLLEKYYAKPDEVKALCGVDQWDPVEEEDEAAYLAETGMAEAVAKDGLVRLPKPTDSIQCAICYDDYPPEEVVSGPCSHFFCTDCFGDYLSLKTREGSDCAFARCPNAGCKCLVPPQLFRSLLEPDLLPKYEKFMIDSYVSISKTLRWCPVPRCEKVFSCPLGTRDAMCAGKPDCCGSWVCFKCGGEAHQPSNCKVLQVWKDKCENDSETANWILANTKRCPKCSTRIEKNQGCNHMTCRECGHDFCWMCMGLWKDHGSETGGYYKCNRY
jgi:ariadne-1